MADNNQPSHLAALRSKNKKTEEFPDDFDARAKQNAMQVQKLHEFRRKNIKDYVPPDKDLFEYDSEEIDKRYRALNFDTLFKFENTFKSIKWGVAVGTMFAAHRYFRTRNFDSASFWFASVSFLSFFNIFLSFGLQEFVTNYGTRKSITLAS